MPGDDEVIRIGAEIDVAPLVSGMQQAVASVDSGSAKMAASFTAASTAATQMAAKLQADGLSAKEAASAMQNLGFSVEEINGALGSTVTNLDNVTRAAQSTSSAVRGMGGSFAVARVEAGALSGSVGMLEGGLARVALASETLGPIMMAAFPAFAALALFEIVGRVADAFKAAADQVMGYTESVRKAEQEDIKASMEIEAHAVTAEEAHRKLARTFQEVQNLGKESYAEKFSAAWEKSAQDTSTAWKYLYAQGYLATHIYDSFANAEATVADRGKQLQDQTRSLQADLSGITATTEKLSLSELEAQHRADIVGKSKIAQLQSELTLLSQKKDLDLAVAAAEASHVAKSPEESTELTARSKADIDKKYAADIQRAQKELSEESARESIALERATAEAKTSIDLAELSRQESLVKQLASMKLLTAEQETAALVRIENEQAEARRKSIEDQISAAKKLQSATGEDQAPKIEGLEAQLVTLKTNTQTKITEIENEGSRKRISQDIEEMNERISNAERVGSAQFSLEEQFAHQGFESHKITTEQETAMLRTAENERYESTRRGLDEQLSEYKKHEELNKKEISATNAAIESLDIHHQANLSRIEFDGDRQRLEEKKRSLEEEIRATEESATKTLESLHRLDDERLAHHTETLAQWVRSEESALDEWYSKEHATLEKSAEETKAIYGERSTEYKKVLAKLLELDQQYAQKKKEIDQKIEDSIRQQYTQITNIINQNLNQMLTHHQSFARTAMQIWNQLVMYVIQQIEKMAEEWVFQHVVMAAASKLFAAQTQASTQDLTKIAQNVAVAQSDAGVSAANTLAWYTAINPPAAPAAAAAMFGIAETYVADASAERGAIIEGPGITRTDLHPEEMVLPANISIPLQAAIANGGFGEAPSTERMADSLREVVESSDRSKTAALSQEHAPAFPITAASALSSSTNSDVTAARAYENVLRESASREHSAISASDSSAYETASQSAFREIGESNSSALESFASRSSSSDVTASKALESSARENAAREYAVAGATGGGGVGAGAEPDLSLAHQNFTVREPGSNLHQSIDRGVHRGGDQNATNTTNHYHTNFRSEFHGIAGHDELEDLFDKKLAPKVQQAMRHGKIKKP